MKAVFGLLGLVAVLGIAYGLAFAGIIPAQKMADKSPALGSFLKTLHLAKAAKRHPSALAPVTAPAPNPEQAALAAGKKQLEADRAQFDQDRLAWEAQKRQAAASPSAGGDSAKINDIYATMSADDIARIAAKLPDPDVVAVLTSLDEKKSGKILAALPVDRAAKITERMSRATPRLQASL